MAVVTYSLKAQGAEKLSPNFTVREFRCKDGSDQILIDGELVELLQRIRDHFGGAVTINSAYRTPAHNKAVGGTAGSQHLRGTAADIVVSGATPLEVAQYAEHLQPAAGGIGVYKSFTHVDVRAKRYRWDSRSGREVAVAGWPGYEETEEETAMKETRYNTVEECPDWARETVGKLVDRKYLDGDGQGLDLSRDMLRVLVVLDRASCFGE